MNRRRPAHRLTSALIGAIVAGIGVLTGALLSGRDLDTELIAIGALAAVGAWLMMTALLAARRPRSGTWAAESIPATSSTADPIPPDADSRHEGTPPHVEAPLTTTARSMANNAKRGRTESQ